MLDFAAIAQAFGRWDAIALAVLAAAWIGSTLLIEHSPKRRPSTANLMAQYRRLWMEQLVTRTPRIFDSSIVSQLRQSTSFFGSASMIAIGGGFALLGNADQLRGVAQDLTHTADPVLVLELKVMLPLALAINAFLKFVWSNRLFGYCSVLMAAVPNDVTDPVAYPRAAKAAEINITAARSYNRGLRSVYFGIASTAWLMGALPLLVATLFTLAVILRREFWSTSRAVLLDLSDKTP
ncbi:DUF599 domain-containing protein [Tropicibacter naphthalenivorans]|uniref:DUF599 domain-containing protein n=1 Tax=Tropicibacter naphthalenivorans TaxID=441103 RepID=A0A0P1GWR5_9RHOB|nr:DUF599 domain-containing protein [Tropicibacter naphthalenivorans]CUH79335.1 hypothetical protein TRN7648_02418 [Tropicibacter naphthalenivorans]SMC71392.1 Uncharacterized membrane protein [Tropicibacter naphthalenivorans]